MYGLLPHSILKGKCVRGMGAQRGGIQPVSAQRIIGGPQPIPSPHTCRLPCAMSFPAEYTCILADRIASLSVDGLQGYE